MAVVYAAGMKIGVAAELVFDSEGFGSDQFESPLLSLSIHCPFEHHHVAERTGAVLLYHRFGGPDPTWSAHHRQFGTYNCLKFSRRLATRCMVERDSVRHYNDLPSL